MSRLTSRPDYSAYFHALTCRDAAGCVLWKGPIGAGGYGYASLFGTPLYDKPKKTNARAHRVAWWLAHAEWPDLCVCHTCDVRNCVNPAHLFLGTHDDNMKDRGAKGRTVTNRIVGAQNGRSKLTVELVRELRKRYINREITAAEAARQHGVNNKGMWNALNGRTWKHA